MENEKYYKVREAVEKTRISQSTINKAIKNKELPAREITDSSSKGFHYMIAESDLMRWLAERKAYVATPKTIEELSMMLHTLMKAEYDRGFEDGKKAQKTAFMEAVRGVK